MKEVYVGCGMSAIEGAINLDNSFSVILGHHKVLYTLCNALGLLNQEQKNFISVVKEKRIKYGHATNLRFPDGSIDVVYSSHTIEHLYEEDFQKFLDESYRVLRRGGIFRLAIPDLRIALKKYEENGNADEFCSTIYMSFRKKPDIQTKISLLLFGNRRHKWMYDGESMKKYIEMHSMFKAEILPVGTTLIKGKTKINLYERECESVYLECIKQK